MTTRVTRIVSEVDDLDQSWTVTVSRYGGGSVPPAADLPEDVRVALARWVNDNDRPTIKPLESFLPSGELRCQDRYGKNREQCGGKMMHKGEGHGPGNFAPGRVWHRH